MFDPWIGAMYAQDANIFAGKKILVLGESHYGQHATDVGTSSHGFTTEVVHELALKRRNRTLNGITSVLVGKAINDITSEDAEAIWQSIIFYNYVPSYVLQGTRPSPNQWRAGAEFFRQVLAEHRPDGVLVCGFQLWDWLVWDASGGSANTRASAVYVVEGVPCAMMKHPSRFSWREWRGSVEALLAPPPAVTV